ncbi:MAG: hypothetical protein Q7V20_23905, partial [Aquabacterium sp.]|uniref:hypothetical protein n=1 Tax=Aquabacterium sp. TaxID=1872578 RepID=UPI00271F15AC
WSYAEASPLLVFDYDTNILAAVLDSVQGVKQGDPVSAFAFAFTVQQLYKDALAAGDGSVIAAAVQDDLTIIGDYRQVFKVFDRLKELSLDYGLELQANKCQVLMPKGYDTDNGVDYTPIVDLCTSHNITKYSSHIRVLGVTLSNGNDSAEEEIRLHVESVIASHDTLFRYLSHPCMPVQIAMLLLRLCMLPRFMHFARSLPPQYVTKAAIDFDKAIMKAFVNIMDIQTDRAPLTEHEKFQIGLKVSKGGIGLRPMLPMLHAYYFASVVPVLPHLKKLFPSSKYDLLDSPIHNDILDCIIELKQQGITDDHMVELGIVTSPLLNADVSMAGMAHAMNGLWNIAPDTIATTGIQHALTKWIENKVYDDFLCSLPEHDPMRIRLLSANGKGASLWQTVIPTKKLLIVKDENYRFEMRTLLGQWYGYREVK